MPSRETYNNRKSNGLCGMCGKLPPYGAFTSCMSCYLRHKKINQKAFQKKREEGLCGYCRKNPADSGLSSCMSCRLFRKKNRKDVYQKQKKEGLCTGCGKVPSVVGKVLCETCRDRTNKVHTEQRKNDPKAFHRKYQTYYRKLKQDVFSNYGSICVCCGETDFHFLTLDHINNNGGEHRRTIGIRGRSSGRNFRIWVRQVGYPLDLQLLCWNCNLAKSMFGKCPHQEKQIQELPD